MENIDTQKATGSDSVSPKILKECASSLAGPITHLFNLSIQRGEVPLQWKAANIIPIAKTKPPSLDQLRPISLIPIISKVLEKVVLSSVKDALISAYGENQFAFRPRSSTLYAHISIVELITSLLDMTQTKCMAIVSVDISKAFDTLQHDKLLQTLDEINLPSGFRKWCHDYLQQRRQRVVLKGSVASAYVNVPSGVPQGSVLSPYLFASHMGSLRPKAEIASYFKFADDVVVVMKVENTSHMEAYLKNELNHIRRNVFFSIMA